MRLGSEWSLISCCTHIWGVVNWITRNASTRLYAVVSFLCFVVEQSLSHQRVVCRSMQLVLLTRYLHNPNLCCDLKCLKAVVHYPHNYYLNSVSYDFISYHLTSNYIPGEMHSMVGWGWYACSYALTTDGLRIQFDMIIHLYISTIQFSLYKQQCSYVHG